MASPDERLLGSGRRRRRCRGGDAEVEGAVDGGVRLASSPGAVDAAHAHAAEALRGDEERAPGSVDGAEGAGLERHAGHDTAIPPIASPPGWGQAETRRRTSPTVAWPSKISSPSRRRCRGRRARRTRGRGWPRPPRRHRRGSRRAARAAWPCRRASSPTNGSSTSSTENGRTMPSISDVFCRSPRLKRAGRSSSALTECRGAGPRPRRSRPSPRRRAAARCTRRAPGPTGRRRGPARREGTRWWRGRHRAHGPAGDLDLARRWLEQRRTTMPQQRRLAGPVVADQGHRLPGGDDQVDGVQREQIAVGLAEVHQQQRGRGLTVVDGRRRPRGAPRRRPARPRRRRPPPAPPRLVRPVRWGWPTPMPAATRGGSPRGTAPSPRQTTRTRRAPSPRWRPNRG